MAGGALPPVLSSPDVDIYRSNNYVVLDFETTVLDKGSALNEKNAIVFAAWHGNYRADAELDDDGAPTHYRKSTWGGEYDLYELVEDCRRADFIVAHNAKFELQWLERCGLDLGEIIVWDTMIGEYVIGGNRWAWHQLSLSRCAKRNFGETKVDIVSKMYDAGLCSRDVPASWLQRYCWRDVELTHRLFDKQRRTIIKDNLLPVMYTRCLLTPVLADIEKNGMMLDSDLVAQMCLQKEREHAEATHELEQFAGNINFNSPVQLADYLYNTLGFEELKVRRGRDWFPDRTPTGRPKTDSATLAKLTARTKKQQDFLTVFARVKSINNELTKYLRKFAACAEEDNGLLTAQFNQTSTATHRLSSSGRKWRTQFQNFPRAMKPVFKARHEGWLVGECDGAQLEFRVASHLGKDKQALADILDPEFDAHLTTASYMEGQDYADIRRRYLEGDADVSVARQEAKAETFKPLYGGRYGTDKQMRWYEGFRERYAGIADAQQHWIEEVLKNKVLVTEWGMRYYWPSTEMKKSGFITNSQAICNYPVQAFATAEIIPIALAAFWHRLRSSDLKMFIVNTVHDSIIVELPPEEVEEFHELAQQCLIEDVYPYLEKVYGVKLTVPLGAGVMVGTHWGSKDETVYNAKEHLYNGR